MNPLRYAQLIILGGLLAFIGFFYLEANHYRNQLNAVRAGQAAYEAVHLVQLTAARRSREQEKADNAKYRREHPIGTVFLCHRSVQVSQPPPSTASPTAGSLPPVHEGDQGLRGEEAGPDIGPLLDAFAASCDAVSADLREQQEVR